MILYLAWGKSVQLRYLQYFKQRHSSPFKIHTQFKPRFTFMWCELNPFLSITLGLISDLHAVFIQVYEAENRTVLNSHSTLLKKTHWIHTAYTVCEKPPWKLKFFHLLCDSMHSGTHQKSNQWGTKKCAMFWILIINLTWFTTNKLDILKETYGCCWYWRLILQILAACQSGWTSSFNEVILSSDSLKWHSCPRYVTQIVFTWENEQEKLF